MDERQVYSENQRIFESGIDSSIMISPYEFRPEELENLESNLRKMSDKFGEPAVLVEWGQPLGGPINARKYHKQSRISRLVDSYRKNNLKGIYPMAGVIFDIEWIQEQRVRLETPHEKKSFDFKGYFRFIEETDF